MRLNELFAHLDSAWPTDTVDTSWPPSSDPADLAAQAVDAIEVEDVVTEVGPDGTVAVTGTLTLAPTWVPDGTTFVSHLFPSLRFQFAPDADWKSAFRASVSPTDVHTIQIDELPLRVLVPADLLRVHPEESKRGKDDGIELAETAGDTVIERVFAFGIESDGTVRLDAHVPISVGPCAVFGLPAKGVHEIVLISAPRKAKESADWIVRDLDAGIIPFDGGALGFGGIELDWTAEGSSLQDVRRRLDIADGAEIVLEDLVIPSVLLPPVPLHGTLGVRHVLNPDEPLAHAISFADAPITIPLGRDARGFISQLFVSTPPDGAQWWSGLTVEGGVSFGSGSGDDRLAVTLGLVDGDVVRLGFEKTPPGSNIPIIHLDLWKITVDITGIKLGVSLVELAEEHPEVGAAIQALGTIYIKEKPGEASGASGDVGITDESGAPFEAALVDVGWDRGKPTGNMVLPRAQLHLSMFVLEVQEMGLAFEHGATYISISGGIRIKSDPFEGGVWFTRLRGKLSGNPDAPGFQLGGIGLELAVQDVVRISAHGMYRDDILADGTRIKEQGLGGGLVVKAGGNEWGLTVDLFWGTRIPTTGEEQNYLLFLIALFGAIPMGPIELRGIEALYATGLLPKIEDGDREAGELKYYSWLKRARPTALPEGRGLDAWKPTKDAWAFGVGVGLSITGAGSVFQLKAFGAGFDSPGASGLIIVIEFGMFGSKKPLALGVFEYDFRRDAFVLMIQLDVDLKDFVDNWPEQLKVRVGGTLTFGNKPGLVALGRLNDPDTWLGARLELELTQLFQLKLRVGICFEWQEDVQVGGGLTVSLTITGSLGVITLQGWGALQVLVRYMLSGTNDFVARIRAELGFAVVLFGFLRFGIAIEALAEWLANVPNYFVFRITFRFETPWFLPDVSYTTEVVTGSLEPETRGVATSPLLESSAQSLTGSRPTRAFRVDHGDPGERTALASVNDLSGASGGWSGDLGDPVPLDATIEIDFSVMVADGLGIDAINPDFGVQVSGDGQLALTTSYRLTRIQVLRSPRGENTWETIEDLTSAASPRNLRWSWDHDTRVSGQTAPKKLLLNGRTPFTVGIGNPLADAEILHDNPGYPCCRVRRPDVARFDFEGEHTGPLPTGFVRDFVYEDRGTVAPVRIHGAPCAVVPPSAAGASVTVVGAFAPSSGPVATVSAAEDLAVASVRLAVAGRHKARLVVVAFDRDGEEVERRQVNTGASAFQDVELDPGRAFATIVVGLEDLQDGQDDGSPAASLALDSVECVTARDRRRFEDERDRCEREGTDGHADTVTFLARHDYQVVLTTEIGVKHSSTNQVTSTITERVGFTTAGPPGLNETPEPGLELEPYIVSKAPGGRGTTYREESVHLVLSDALKVFGPGSGTGETDFRLPITIAVESAFDANAPAHAGKSSRASADWFVAHRGELDPWVTTATLGTTLALAHDGRALRYRALTEASSGSCPPDATWVEKQPRVGVEPFDPNGRPLWEPRASYVAVMRLEGSPVVEREPFEAADVSSFSATSGAWSVVDGVLQPVGSATGAFGDSDWDLYRVDVRGSLGPAGEIGVVVLADAAAVSHGVRAILRRGAGEGGALVVETATGSALGSAPVALIGTDSTLAVEVFADAVRCSVGEAVVSVPRGERGPGPCQLLATGADIVSLRVHGVDMYRRPFRTSAYEGFAEHVATCTGLERHDVGAAAEPLASLRARLSGSFAAAMDPAAPDEERETAFGDAASALAVPLREDADRLHVTCASAGADRWLLLETPEPMDFTEEIELHLTRKVVSQGVSPADRARLEPLIEYALQHPTPSPFPFPLPWRDHLGVRRLVIGNRFGGILDAPGTRKAAYRAHLDGKYLVLDDLRTATESRVRAPALGREDRELLADVTWTLNAQLQIIGWEVPVHVSWVDQPCAVIQNATATHALVIPSGALADGDYRLDLAIRRRWFDTLDPVGPANSYLDDAQLAFTLSG